MIVYVYICVLCWQAMKLRDQVQQVRSSGESEEDKDRPVAGVFVCIFVHVHVCVCGVCVQKY